MHPGPPPGSKGQAGLHSLDIMKPPVGSHDSECLRHHAVEEREAGQLHHKGTARRHANRKHWDAIQALHRGGWPGGGLEPAA